jgi:hypothetical protein
MIERSGWLPREPQNVVTSDMWRSENGEVFQP